MHVFLSKSTKFESTDFASVMIDDVGCSVPSVHNGTQLFGDQVSHSKVSCNHQVWTLQQSMGIFEANPSFGTLGTNTYCVT